MRLFFPKVKNEATHRKINTAICIGSLGLTQILKGTIVAAFPALLFWFFFAQFLGSTVQGGWSDVRKRSTVLNIAFLVIITSLCSLQFILNFEGMVVDLFKICFIILIGFGGNADVVSRAEIIDLHCHMDRRALMSWTVFTESSSWILIGCLMRFINLSEQFILILCVPVTVVLLILSLTLNTDDKKITLREFFSGIKTIFNENQIKLSIMILIVIFTELAYFLFFYDQEIFIHSPELLADSYLYWFGGMSLGCLILTKFKSHNDFNFLISGMLMSLIALFVFLLGGMKSIENPDAFYFNSISYFISGCGSGFYLPCFYSMISRHHSTHYQGFLTGMIDSFRVLGDTIINGVLLLVVNVQYLPIILSGLFFVGTVMIVLLSRKHVFGNS